MPTRLTCDAITPVDEADHQHYNSVLKPMYAVPAEVSCGLETRHEDLHRALIQASGPNEWWLRWTDTRREVVVPLMLCGWCRTECAHIGRSGWGTVAQAGDNESLFRAFDEVTTEAEFHALAEGLGVDDNGRVCTLEDLLGRPARVATGLDRSGRPTFAGSELVETPPVVLLEPPRSVLMQSPDGSAEKEAQTEAAVTLGFTRWLPGLAQFRPPGEWTLRRTADGLELIDPSRSVFSRAAVRPDPRWLSAAVSDGSVLVVYGPMLGVRIPPGMTATRYSKALRREEFRRSRDAGMVAAALVPYVNS